MTTLGALITCLFCLAALILPKRMAALSLLAGALYITQGQSIQLGINFLAIRFVEVAVVLRVLARGESKGLKFNVLDRWLLIFFTTLFAFITVRTGEFDAYEFGTVVDGWLVYFCCRALISEPVELDFFIKGAAVLLIPFALLMAFEAQTGRNLFGIIMGGVPDTPDMRDGHYRCQGSFRHAITAGTVGASFVSLFVGYLFRKPRSKLMMAGVIACIVIVLASHSSGPLMAAITAVMGWACWYVRDRMQLVRRGIVAVLVFLHLAMSSPVWFIFDRLSGILGGDGWHRSNLIDKFLTNWSKWFVSGMPFIDTSDWAATQLPWGGVDVTNFYISVGLIGGIVPLICFIILLVRTFKHVGRAAAFLRAQSLPDVSLEAVVWGIGCTICVHVLNLSAVIYWDQSYVIWYSQLAIAASLSSYYLNLPDSSSVTGAEGAPLPATVADT